MLIRGFLLSGIVPREGGDMFAKQNFNYRQASNISRTLVSNNIVDHWNVVGVSPIGAAQTTPFSI